MSHNCNEEAVGIVRINRHFGDLLAIPQAQVRPRGAGIGGFIDSVAHRQIGTMQAFAAGNVDHVRVRRRDFNSAD